MTSRDGSTTGAAPFRAENITAGYGATRVVEDVSFAVPAGGRLAILGRNGVGKTTLFAALMGLARCHAGRIVLDDTDLTEVMTALHALTERRTVTAIIVEQQIERAMDFASDTLIMDRGRVVWSGTSIALKADRETVERSLGVGGLH